MTSSQWSEGNGGSEVSCRRSDDTPTSPLWAFMWLYIKHSWVLVRPGVFTQRWVLTLGTGFLSRAGASGAARLIGASGRSSEGAEAPCWTSGYQLKSFMLCNQISRTTVCSLRARTPSFLQHYSIACHQYQEIRALRCYCAHVLDSGFEKNASSK